MLFVGSCNEAIRNLRRAGLLREGLSQKQIEEYAQHGPLVALIGGKGQHVGIVALENGKVMFFSNSTGHRRVEPLSNRMSSITGVLILK